MEIKTWTQIKKLVTERTEVLGRLQSLHGTTSSMGQEIISNSFQSFYKLSMFPYFFGALGRFNISSREEDFHSQLPYESFLIITVIYDHRTFEITP